MQGKRKENDRSPNPGQKRKSRKPRRSTRQGTGLEEQADLVAHLALPSITSSSTAVVCCACRKSTWLPDPLASVVASLPRRLVALDEDASVADDSS